jgi:hypothetical protein
VLPDTVAPLTVPANVAAPVGPPMSTSTLPAASYFLMPVASHCKPSPGRGAGQEASRDGDVRDHRAGLDQLGRDATGCHEVGGHRVGRQVALPCLDRRRSGREVRGRACDLALRVRDEPVVARGGVAGPRCRRRSPLPVMRGDVDGGRGEARGAGVTLQPSDVVEVGGHGCAVGTRVFPSHVPRGCRRGRASGGGCRGDRRRTQSDPRARE